jgi:predicted GIY-YIG superfamily endonuclease
MGLIYLLHFDRSYRHARHYLGYTENLEARLTAHRAGRGSPLVAAAVRDGTDFQLAATWPGDRTKERRLHRYRNSPRRLCPICRERPDPHAPATTVGNARSPDTEAADDGTAATA